MGPDRFSGWWGPGRPSAGPRGPGVSGTVMRTNFKKISTPLALLKTVLTYSNGPEKVRSSHPPNLSGRKRERHTLSQYIPKVGRKRTRIIQGKSQE